MKAFGKTKRVIQAPSIIIIAACCLPLQLGCWNPKACDSTSDGGRMIMRNTTGHLEPVKGKHGRENG